MATQVNIHEAKTHLSRLVARAAAGEEIVISKAGTPMAKLVAYERPKEPRKLGALRGQIEILPGFDEMDDEITRLFEGE
jgi:prevent-host-death family protein